MERDVILVFLGGAMGGVFGAGVATSLQDFGVHKKVHSIYSISAGAHNAAYFLCKESRKGSSIYYEDLTEDKFIKRNNLKFILKIILNSFLKIFNIKSLVDIDYLMNVEKKTKILDLNKISKSKIKSFVRCFDFDLDKEKYLDGKSKTLKKLKATSAMIPFYLETVKINGKKYADGDILSRKMDPELKKIINKNKNKRVFFVFNSPLRKKNSINHFFANALWTILLIFYSGKISFARKLKYKKDKELENTLTRENINFVDPDYEISPFCTKRDKLSEFYSHGKEKGKEIAKEILK